MIEVNEAVLLRPLEPRDIKMLYEFRNSPAVVSGLGGFSTGYSELDLEEWLNYHRNRDDEVLWCIAERSSDRCVGHIGLYQIDFRVRKAELAIAIGHSDFRGRGLGKKCCESVMNYGFEQLNLRRIELSVLASNERALALYGSLGFEVEGTLRDAQFRDGNYVDVVLMAIIR